jgi:hypothetical protein
MKSRNIRKFTGINISVFEDKFLDSTFLSVLLYVECADHSASSNGDHTAFELR